VHPSVALVFVTCWIELKAILIVVGDRQIVSFGNIERITQMFKRRLLIVMDIKFGGLRDNRRNVDNA